MTKQLLERFTTYPTPIDDDYTVYGQYLIATVSHPDDNRDITAIKYQTEDDTAWSYYDTDNHAVALQQAIDDYITVMDNDPDLDHLQKMTAALKEAM